MFSYLSQTASLNNLGNSRATGQIATLLILFMVVVLIFVLVTANIGQISLTTTNLANAADAGTLYLCSQLGTKSRMLWDALGGRIERCKKRGFGGIIGGIIGAIVGLALAPFTGGLSLLSFCTAQAAGAGAVIGTAIVGGTIGGAIGGAIAGPGLLQGAIQGFTVGASIGGGLTAVGSMVSASTISGLGTLAANSAAVGLASATNLYPAYIADQMVQAAFTAAAKALNGLNEEDRIRESVFLQVLSQTVDDPNGGSFQSWWENRVSNFSQNIPQIQGISDAFFQGPAKAFSDFVQAQSANAGALCRQEVNGADGSLVFLARGLEETDYAVSFWEPGTPPADDPECEECSYYDDIDRVSGEFKEITESIDSWGKKGLDQLADQWEDWAGIFYGKEGETDYYETLGELQGTLTNWKEELKSKRLMLPECILGPCLADPAGLAEICNPPCRLQTQPGQPFAGTIDEKLDSEFDPAIAAIDNMVSEMEKFRAAVRDTYDKLKAAASQPGDPAAFGGKNSATYSWTDARGAHSVTVETQFTIPYLRKKKSRKKICMILMNASGKPWVKVTRRDPSDKPVGILGKWNPLAAGSQIIRLSRGLYSYDRVELTGTR